MNPCLWFLVLQELGALQTSLLKPNRRLKQRDSLPFNAARGAEGTEVLHVVQGQSSGSWSGRLHPSDAEAFCTFAHNILHFLPYARFFCRSEEEDGPMVNTLVSPRPILLLLSAPFLPLSPETGGSGVLPVVTFSAFGHAKNGLEMCVFYVTMSNSGVSTKWGCLDTVETNGLTRMDGSPQRGLGAEPRLGSEGKAPPRS